MIQKKEKEIPTSSQNFRHSEKLNKNALQKLCNKHYKKNTLQKATLFKLFNKTSNTPQKHKHTTSQNDLL